MGGGRKGEELRVRRGWEREREGEGTGRTLLTAMGHLPPEGRGVERDEGRGGEREGGGG